MSFEPQTTIAVLPYLFLAVLMALVLSILVLISFVFFSASFFKRIMSSRSELEKRRREAHKEAEEILEKARKEAAEFISRANAKALEILEAAKNFSAISEKEIDKILQGFMESQKERLEKNSEKFAKAYEDLSAEVRKSYSSSVEALLRAMREDAGNNMLEVRKNLEQELTRYRGDADAKLQEWREAALREIEEYKKTVFARVDEVAYQIVNRAAKEIFGEALDLRHQQKMVLSSLERAKKEGFFYGN